MTNFSVSNYIQKIKNQLEKTVDRADAEQYAWWLLEAATGKSKTLLITELSTAISDDIQARIDHWLDQIINYHMPLAYAIGSVSFAGCTINVRSPVLIPRPETEQWVIELIEHLKPYSELPLRILDLCTGSGCLAIAIACALPKAQIIAIDNAPHALELARENIRLNNIHTITVLQSDLFDAILPDMCFDIIVTNPPYISPEEWQTLDLSVKNWEDPNALIAHHHGLAFIQTIIMNAQRFLKPSSLINAPQLVIEIGYNQGLIVHEMMKQVGFKVSVVKKDYSGYDRVVWGSMHDFSFATET